MEKMCNYELLFAINGTLPEEEITAIKDKFITLVNDNATDVAVNEWGKRRFAYPVNDIAEGYYVLVDFKSAPAFPLELERVLGITEGVVRYLTTAKNAKATVAAPVAPATETEAPAENAEA